MNSGEVRRYFQLVGNFSSFGKNAKRTDVTRGQFAFDTEAMGSLKRSNPKVSLIANFKSHSLMMTIILALLVRLGCFQFLTNDANLLFGFLDHIRTKELSFPGF